MFTQDTAHEVPQQHNNGQQRNTSCQCSCGDVQYANSHPVQCGQKTADKEAGNHSPGQRAANDIGKEECVQCGYDRIQKGQRGAYQDLQGT